MTKLEAACFIEVQIMADRCELDYASPAMKILLENRIEANEIALNAIKEWHTEDNLPVPDPITGLVPCGCGGKSEFLEVKWCIGDDGGVIAYCLNCLVKTAKHMTKEQATHDWNTAMGYKEEA